MRRFGTALAACLTLALGGFAAAVVAGKSPASILQTTSTTTTTTVPSKKVTICHRTGSKKKPYRKIRVSTNALKAHLRHGDILAGAGACPSTVQRTDLKGHIVKTKKKHKK